MKNALIGLFSFMILLLAGFAINTSEGRTLRENELSSTVSSSMEKSMEILKLKKDYSITEQKEFAADFIQNAMVKMNSKSKYDVEIMTIDVEKGLLDAKVTETYKQFARPGKVSVRKTIILEDYQNVNNEYFIVTFQDKDGKIVKQMNVYGGSNMDVTLLPHEWKTMKFTCLESGIEYTIDTLPGLIVTSNLTFKLGEDSERPHFTVIYNENGGSGKMDPSTFFIGENDKLKKNVYTRNGHTFIGWNTQPNGLGTFYKDEAEIQNMTSINGSEIVLYAQWESKEEYYYIDYDPNGGSGTMDPSKHVVGKGGTIEKSKFTYSGYEFKEWNTVKNGSGIKFQAGSFTNFNLTKDKRVRLYAQWEKAPEYGIYFVKKPEISIANNKYSAEASIKVSHPRDYIKSYKIWLDDKSENTLPATWSDAVTDFNGQKQEIRLYKNNIEQKESIQYVHFAGKAEHGETVSDVIAIPAKEIPKPYTVTYKANGGVESDNVQEVERGKNWYVQGTIFTKKGYTLKSWNTDPSGNGKTYELNSSQTPINGNLTLYAVWEENTPTSYTVTYKANGGIGNDDNQEVLVGNSWRVQGAIFVKQGCILDSWNTEPSGNGIKYEVNSLQNSLSNNITLYAQWKEEVSQVYYVRYHSNGGTGDMPISTHEMNQKSQLSENKFVRNGYRFLGWSINQYAKDPEYQNKHSIYNLTTAIGSTVDLYAIWESEQPAVYTVTYKANGGVGNDYVQEVDANSGWYVKDAIFKQPGYTLKSWNTAPNGSGEQYELNSYYNSLEKNIILYAQWEATEYTITYKSNGGYGEDNIQTVSAGNGYYLRGEIFTRNGYVLKSWNTEKNGNGARYELDAWQSSLNNDLILYAQWEQDTPKTYTVRYNSNGGSGYMTNSTHTINEYSNLSQCQFTRSGYKFLGWSTNRYDVRPIYYDMSRILNLSTTSGAIVDLYAIWEQVQPTSYTVTYYANDGSNASVSETVTPGLSWYTKNTDTFTRQGYKLVSWNTRADGLGEEYGMHIYQDPIQSDITLYAKWEENTSSSYTITYKANGGVGEEQQQIVLKGSAFYYRGVIFTKTNHTLASWNTDPYGNGQRYELDAFQASLDKNITLYAQWKENSSTTYTVTYKPNQGDGSDYFQSLRKDEYFMPKAGLFTRSGYKLVCWNTKPNGSGDQYDFNTLYPELTGDLVLYAQWRPNSEVEHIIVYDSNDEFNETQTQIVKPGEGWYVRGGIFFKDGYTLDCWTTRPDGGGTRYELDEWKPSLNEDLRLYAHWVNNAPW